MALPSLIDASGQLYPPSGGPFLINGSYYYVCDHAAGGPDVFKADDDDPATTWTRQDTAGAPAQHVSAMHAVADGTDIYIAGQNSTTENVYFYHFDASTDTWTTIDDLVSSTPDGVGVFCTIAKRSDTILIAYKGKQEKIMGTNYRRIHLARGSAASWTTDVDIYGSGLQEDFEDAYMVVTEHDRAHILFTQGSSGGFARYSTFLNDNTFSHQGTLVSVMPGTDDGDHSKAISFKNGQDTEVRFMYITGFTARISGFIDSDTPGEPKLLNSSVYDSTDSNFFVYGAYQNFPEESGAIQWVIYPTGSPSTDELWLIKTEEGGDIFGDAELILDSRAGIGCYSATVGPIDGLKMLLAVLEGGDPYYHEEQLFAPTATVENGTAGSVPNFNLCSFHFSGWGWDSQTEQQKQDILADAYVRLKELIAGSNESDESPVPDLEDYAVEMHMENYAVDADNHFYIECRFVDDPASTGETLTASHGTTIVTNIKNEIEEIQKDYLVHATSHIAWGTHEAGPEHLTLTTYPATIRPLNATSGAEQLTLTTYPAQISHGIYGPQRLRLTTYPATIEFQRYGPAQLYLHTNQATIS